MRPSRCPPLPAPLRLTPPRWAALLVAPVLALSPVGPAPRASAAPAEPAAAGKALDAFFKGQVIALKGKDLTLRYDFSTQEQLNDWREGVPWPIAKETPQGIAWFDQRLEVKGSTGARHLAEWSGETWVTCTLTLDADRDVGGFLSPADEGDCYAAFSLVEKYFHAWDAHAGGLHSILKFGREFREAGSAKDFIGFRYVDRRPPPTPVKAGDVLTFGFGLQKGKLGLDCAGLELRGKDLGSKRFKEYRPGFYTIKGRLLVDNVVISGRLADGWVAAERLALRTDKPLPDPASLALDPAVQGLIDGYRAHTTPAADLVKAVGDGGSTKAARDALVEALGAGPRKAVNDVLDLLYRPEVEVRTAGIEVVRRLLGKDYGYAPKGSEEQRSEAIRRLLDDLKKKPTLLDGP